MKHDPNVAGKRRPVNLSLDTGIVAAAREAGINLSRVTEAALRAAVRDQQEARWKQDNAAAIAAFADWYERDGDPLAHLRIA